MKRSPSTAPSLSSRSLARSLRGLGLATAVAASGVCLFNGMAHAEDAADGEELKDRVFRAFSIDKIGEMTGLHKSEEEKRGIEYRERSPLVVPKSRDLPPPESAPPPPTATNWPRDPGAAGPAAGRKASKPAAVVTTQQPGTSELPANRGGGPGIDWSAFSTPWSKKKAEAVQFTGEPARETLTQPPAGYQTPSPDFAYGTGGEVVPEKFVNPTVDQK